MSDIDEADIDGLSLKSLFNIYDRPTGDYVSVDIISLIFSCLSHNDMWSASSPS